MADLMTESLDLILQIQNLDIKMIRLLRLRRGKEKELEQIQLLRQELRHQIEERETELSTLKEQAALLEKKIDAIKAHIKNLESQQAVTKKLDEFNTITKAIASSEKEKTSLEQELAHIEDRWSQEDHLQKNRMTLEQATIHGKELEEEILATIAELNKEGAQLKQERDLIANQADTELLKIYNKLLLSKRDRVVVPIENRICTGCHISLTAQHENLARRGTKVVFCEHCSRILYIPEAETETEAGTTKRRRRRVVKTT